MEGDSSDHRRGQDRITLLKNGELWPYLIGSLPKEKKRPRKKLSERRKKTRTRRRKMMEQDQVRIRRRREEEERGWRWWSLPKHLPPRRMLHWRRRWNRGKESLRRVYNVNGVTKWEEWIAVENGHGRRATWDPLNICDSNTGQVMDSLTVAYAMPTGFSSEDFTKNLKERHIPFPSMPCINSVSNHREKIQFEGRPGASNNIEDYSMQLCHDQ